MRCNTCTEGKVLQKKPPHYSLLKYIKYYSQKRNNKKEQSNVKIKTFSIKFHEILSAIWAHARKKGIIYGHLVPGKETTSTVTGTTGMQLNTAFKGEFWQVVYLCVTRFCIAETTVCF